MPRARLSAQQQAIRKGGQPKRRVLYTTHAGPQTDFLESEAEEVLYGGAKGGGKSYALRAWAVRYCMTYPGARVVLFRQSYRQLEETHIISIQQEVPAVIAHYSSKSHDLIFKNGSILHLRFCEKDEDARCLGVDTPVLTADLRWVRAGDLRVGDKVVGLDDNIPGAQRLRKLRKATITAQSIVDAPTYRIHFTDGRVIDATPEHAWIRWRHGQGLVWTTTEELYKLQDRPNRCYPITLRQIVPNARPRRDYDAGFLSAAFDGEGSLYLSARDRSKELTFTQKNNGMMAAVKRMLQDQGYLFHENLKPNSDVYNLRTAKGATILRFLMEMRPPRLLARWVKQFDATGMALPNVADVEIDKIDPLEVRKIARLSSSTQTYIADGFAAHNTYDTAEFDAILLDELTHFTQFIYTYLTSRCRSTKSWWPGPRIRAGATPLGRGHGWVKARWFDPAKPGEVWQGPVAEGGMTRQYIPAKVTDNDTLMKADPNYTERLRALPYEEYRAAMGDWEVFMGQFFVRWRPELHVVKPFDIPPDWDRFLCVDYGFGAPYAALWFARPPGTQVAYFYREQYGEGVKLTEQVYRAKQATMDASETLRAVVLDPSLFSKVNVKGEQIESMADDWKRGFGGIAPVLKGNNERVPGWRLMREMIDWTEDPTGRISSPPRFFVFDTCVNLVRTLPLLIVNEHNVEDVDSDGEDHAPDAARYGLRHAFSGAGRRGVGQRYAIGPGGIVTR